MRGVSSRHVAISVLIFLFVAIPVVADSGGGDSGPWPQFVAWLNARIGIPIGATSDSITFDEWLVLMARIGIPIG